MLILGLILLIVGYFVWRPLFVVGAVLALIGLVLWLADSPGPVGQHWY